MRTTSKSACSEKCLLSPESELHSPLPCCNAPQLHTCISPHLAAEFETEHVEQCSLCTHRGATTLSSPTGGARRFALADDAVTAAQMRTTQLNDCPVNVTRFFWRLSAWSQVGVQP